MKKYLLMLALIAFGCQGQPRGGRVTILHTNDMHAQYAPAPATWVQGTPKPLVGGMTALQHFVNEQRRLYPNSLLLDAGDYTTGTMLTKIKHNGAFNGAFVEMMNLVGYDAAAVGNHEFDEGQENMRRLFELAQFDVLSANLTINGKAVAQPFKIYNVGNLRVGVIGLMLPELFSVAAEKHLGGVRVADPLQTAQRLIDKIDRKTDLIVLLSHLGVEKDIELARGVRGADIIVGGHSHTLLRKPLQENGVLIVQAGTKARSLGRLTVDVRGDSISWWNYDLINVWADSATSPDPQMSALVRRFDEQIEAEYGGQIGMLQTDWKQNERGESNIGNFIADVMRSTTGCDVAIMNSGGIRKSMPAGPVKRMDIWEILPFSNYVVTFEATGDQLLRLIGNDVDEHIQKGSSLYQISGLSYAFRRTADGRGELVEARILDAPIDPAKIYRGATVDFVMDQWRQNFMFQNVRTTPSLIADLLIEHIEKNPQIDSKVEGRIRRVN